MSAFNWPFSGNTRDSLGAVDFLRKLKGRYRRSTAAAMRQKLRGETRQKRDRFRGVKQRAAVNAQTIAHSSSRVSSALTSGSWFPGKVESAVSASAARN